MKISASSIVVGDKIKIDWGKDWRTHLQKPADIEMTVDEITTDLGMPRIVTFWARDGLTFSVSRHSLIERVPQNTIYENIKSEVRECLKK